MSSLLEGIKGLMRGSKGLPDSMSSTEVNHYAAEVLERLKRGDDAQALAQYLRRIATTNSGKFPITAANQELAERVFVFFNK